MYLTDNVPNNTTVLFFCGLFDAQLCSQFKESFLFFISVLSTTSIKAPQAQKQLHFQRMKNIDIFHPLLSEVRNYTLISNSQQQQRRNSKQYTITWLAQKLVVKQKANKQTCVIVAKTRAAWNMYVLYTVGESQFCQKHIIASIKVRI